MKSSTSRSFRQSGLKGVVLVSGSVGEIKGKKVILVYLFKMGEIKNNELWGSGRQCSKKIFAARGRESIRTATTREVESRNIIICRG